MIEPSNNPFERETDAWQFEVDAAAAELLRTGAASSPSAAQQMATRAVQQRRASAAAVVILTPSPDQFEELRKVFGDQGGPLTGTFHTLDACSPGTGCMGKTCAGVQSADCAGFSVPLGKAAKP